MNPYTNLTEALEGLICQGYNMNFVAKKDGINVRNHKYKINYNEIEINYAYHFKDSDPKLDAIIYAITSKKHCIKGLMILNCSVLLETTHNKLKNNTKV